MRVDAYQQIQQVYSQKQTGRATKSEKTGFQDQLQISAKGKDIQTAKQAVEAAPDVREEITAPLKEAVESGAYEVGVDDFAAHLFRKYNEMNLGSF